MRRAVSLFAAFAALAVPAAAQADTGDIIVKRDPGLDRSQRLAVRQNADVRLVDALSLPDTEVVDPQGSQAAALAALRKDPSVVYAEPDGEVHALRYADDDPYWGYQWDLENDGQNDAYNDPGVAG